MSRTLHTLPRALRTTALTKPLYLSPLHRRASTQSTPPPSGNAVTPTPLDWDTFLRLRKSRRRYNLGSSILTAFLGTTVGTSYIANKEIDMTQLIMGLDPLIVFGLATMSFGAAGWLAGPALGGAVFNMANRKLVPQIAVREKEFLTRIRKNRVDPSNQSMSNPVPDYYGEKIGSVKDYRQWLKDQRAFKLKREKFL